MIRQFFYPAANQGHAIYAHVWLPDPSCKPKGIIQICHGMAEHVLRYHDFAQEMTGLGYLVCGNDHAGHGRSVASRQDLGFFGEAPGSYHFLLQDMDTLFQIMKDQYPQLPYFILGHSMGTFLSQLFAKEKGDALSGLLLLGCCAGHPFLDTAISFCERQSQKRGAKKKEKAIYSLMFPLFNLHCQEHRTDFDWLSRDTKEVDCFLQDPLCGFIFPYAGFRELLYLLRASLQPEGPAAIPPGLPLLFLSGEDDPVGEYGKGIAALVTQYQTAGSQDITFHIYSHARHELLHETNRKEVIQFISKWIAQKLPN